MRGLPILYIDVENGHRKSAAALHPRGGRGAARCRLGEWSQHPLFQVVAIAVIISFKAPPHRIPLPTAIALTVDGCPARRSQHLQPFPLRLCKSSRNGRRRGHTHPASKGGFAPTAVRSLLPDMITCLISFTFLWAYWIRRISFLPRCTAMSHLLCPGFILTTPCHAMRDHPDML